MTATTNLPLHLRRSVSIRPVSAEGWHAMSGDRRATHRSATASFLYITRGAGADEHGRLDFRHRDDLVARGLELPASHPKWAGEEGRIWRELDAVMHGLPADAIRAWHVAVTLPVDAAPDDWIALIRRYADRTIARFGPAVAWAIHAKADGAGGWAIPPHAHLLITTRVWRHDARHGCTVPTWCGRAMQARLHGEWLVVLPRPVQAAATSAYSVGARTPAHPDCSALRALFDPAVPRPPRHRIRRTRRRPSHRIRKEGTGLRSF